MTNRKIEKVENYDFEENASGNYCQTKMKRGTLKSSGLCDKKAFTNLKISL